eukprot:TRINITY_DN35268_c0_g1_i1.p1 TRINITY_DN35268_c0_g1~~TRINITY_DN35268_c0_g1_i1.p1  ORF type:complete len:463 (+),score=110.79 TRINITY_DN35268_c0_g1_i1:83-1471(+)
MHRARGWWRRVRGDRRAGAGRCGGRAAGWQLARRGAATAADSLRQQAAARQLAAAAGRLLAGALLGAGFFAARAGQPARAEESQKGETPLFVLNEISSGQTGFEATIMINAGGTLTDEIIDGLFAQLFGLARAAFDMPPGGLEPLTAEDVERNLDQLSLPTMLTAVFINAAIWSLGRDLLPRNLHVNQDAAVHQLLNHLLRSKMDPDRDQRTELRDFREFLRWFHRELRQSPKYPMIGLAEGEAQRSEAEFEADQWRLFWDAFDPGRSGSLGKLEFASMLGHIGPLAMLAFPPEWVDPVFTAQMWNELQVGGCVPESSLRTPGQSFDLEYLQRRYQDCVEEWNRKEAAFEAELEKERKAAGVRSAACTVAAPAVVACVRTRTTGQPCDCSLQGLLLNIVFAFFVAYVSWLPFKSWLYAQSAQRQEAAGAERRRQWKEFMPEHAHPEDEGVVELELDVPLING